MDSKGSLRTIYHILRDPYTHTLQTNYKSQQPLGGEWRQKGRKAMLLSLADMELRHMADKQSHSRNGDFTERESKPRVSEKAFLGSDSI